MSHFVMYVFHNDEYENELERLLAPYDENLPCAPYIKYTREQAIEEVRKEIEDYKNTTYAKYLNDPMAYKERCKDNQNHIDYLEKEFPKRLQWTDEECYEEKKSWFEDNMIDEEGNLLSTYNPNSKWDWYDEEGGRWKDYLVNKEGVNVNEGKVSNIDFDKTPVPFGYIDTIGRWFEKGDMGWWGIVTNEKDKDEWEEKYRNYISTLNPETIVTVVDCHI